MLDFDESGSITIVDFISSRTWSRFSGDRRMGNLPFFSTQKRRASSSTLPPPNREIELMHVKLFISVVAICSPRTDRRRRGRIHSKIYDLRLLLLISFQVLLNSFNCQQIQKLGQHLPVSIKILYGLQFALQDLAQFILCQLQLQTGSFRE